MFYEVRELKKDLLRRVNSKGLKQKNLIVRVSIEQLEAYKTSLVLIMS